MGNTPNNKNNQTMPVWIPRLLGIIIVSVIAVAFSVFIVLKLASFISWVLIALFLSFALEPLVNSLVQRGLKRTIATALVLFSFALMAALVVGAMVPLIIDQINEVVKTAPGWLANASDSLHKWFGISVSVQTLLDQIKSADVVVANYATNVAGNIFGLSKQIFVGVLQVLAILLFTFYLVKDAHQVRRFVCSFLPQDKQKIVLKTWELAIDKTGAYIYSRALLGVLSATVTLLVLLALGVPFALPLALWMGVVSQFLPVIGTYLAASIPLFVALIHSPSSALVLLVFIVVYQQIENYYLSPKITAHTMELHPAVAFGAALAGGSIAGVVGALLALPIAAIAQEGIRAYSNRHELVDSSMLRHPVRKPRASRRRKKLDQNGN
ncbi:MAG: AI-2E family transporter [Candidatus Saccharimonadales bacterium]